MNENEKLVEDLIDELSEETLAELSNNKEDDE